MRTSPHVAPESRTSTPPSRRDLLARHALSVVPKLLTLEDRNPHSPTYGCFDRNYWHYRILDFPSGMSQEAVWPLALAWDTPLKGNRFYRSEPVRQAVLAGIGFAAKSMRADGSCDDYYPFERAAGAAAFSLVACLEAERIIGDRTPALDRLIDERASWLAGNRESGRLSNHEALIALALHMAGVRLGTTRWRAASEARLLRVLGWQDVEGWFWEYDGCDPGYLTLTIGTLAMLHDLSPRIELEQALKSAVTFALELAHPDGTFGGEYGSRNTSAFFPHGFERVGRWMGEALALNDLFLAALAAGRTPCFSDDHVLAHHAWSYLLAWRSFVRERPPPLPRREGRRVFMNAAIVVDRRAGTELYIAVNKGGVFKLFRNGALACSDTQVSLLVENGDQTRNAVGHLVDQYPTFLGADTIELSGTLGWAKNELLTVPKMVLLRLVMLVTGRMAPDLVRRFLQRRLVIGKRDAPFRFVRTLRWDGTSWWITDEISAQSWRGVTSAIICGNQTSIAVAMSRTFDTGQLRPVLDLTARVQCLEEGEPLVVARKLG